MEKITKKQFTDHAIAYGLAPKSRGSLRMQHDDPKILEFITNYDTDHVDTLDICVKTYDGIARKTLNSQGNPISSHLQLQGKDTKVYKLDQFYLIETEGLSSYDNTPYYYTLIYRSV